MAIGGSLILLFFYLVPSSHTSKSGRRTVTTLAADYNHFRSISLSWLSERGTSLEIILFTKLTEGISKRVVELAHEENTGFNRIEIQMYCGFLRSAFVFVSGLRLWMVLMIAALWIGVRKFTRYRASDLLGRTGNDKIFYSGIRAGLSSTASDSIPDLLLTGVACPKQISVDQLERDPLFGKLKGLGLINNTNTTLLRMIHAYPSIPGFIKGEGDAPAPSLPDYTHRVVDSVVACWDTLFGDKIKATTNSDPLQTALIRVLTPSLKEAMKEVRLVEVVTGALAVQAGKILAFGEEGNKWVQSSNFPQLCARAILHSIPAYGEDYLPEVRTKIRHALIYGDRFSPLGPVRLPVDLTPASRALRQWIEILLARPARLSNLTDDVELYGYMIEAFAAFEHSLSKNLRRQQPIEGAIATETGLLFLSVSSVVKEFKKLLPESTAKRFHDLVREVGTRHQQLIHAKESATADSPKGSPLPQFQRILPMPQPKQLDGLAKQLDCSLTELRDWLAFRNIFNVYGWLARRVGNASVPEYSCVYTVLHMFDGKDRTAKKALIPFRGIWFEDTLGKFWRSYFPTALRASIAETKEDCDKLLAGKEDLFEDELDGPQL